MMQGLAKNTRRAMRRARRRRGTELNLVSMIDVLTVLVFFLLVNQISVSVLGIELPGPAVASAAPPPVQDLSVIVRPDSLTLANNNEPMATYARAERGYDYEALAAKLTELKRAAPDDTRIALLLDPAIPYEILVSLMDTVRQTTATVAEPAAELFPDVSVGVAPVAVADATIPPAETPAAEVAP